MKYSKINQPIVCMMKNSTCYKGTRETIIKGILWHSTGANNPNISRYVQPYESDADYAKMIALIGKNKNKNDWNHISRQAGLNAWIGKLADGTVATVQTMPWNYRPWGCGSGSKGSCNDGWIQFEICEDKLTDKAYFEKVYKEACELTAYLCKEFNIDPKGTVKHKGVNVPTILCHYDAYELGLGSNHSDIYHWFKKYGKDMNTVRNDVAELMTSKIPAATVQYRVRKSWADAKSQIGAYSNLDNAKVACDKAGAGYHVFDASGKSIYSVVTTTFKNGDEVMLVSGAKYSSGKSIPAWLFDAKLYVREIRDDGNVVISTLKTGAITGVVAAKDLVDYKNLKTPKSYKVRINTDVLRVRAGAGISYDIKSTVKKGQVVTILEEKDGWGQINKPVSGWISLEYTKKV